MDCKFDELRASEEALLPSSDIADEKNNPYHINGQFKAYRESWINITSASSNRALWLHISLIITYTTIFLLSYRYIPATQSQREPIFQSPANSAIQLESRVLHNSVDASNPFKGPPSPELDEAWRGLLKHSNIRLSAEELEAMNRTSVQLADGSGDYVGGLDVYHQLHCLKYIRHYIHRDYYSITKTNVPSSEHVDASIQTYSWIPTLRIPWANFDKTIHECTNWEALDGWAAERSFDIYDPENLRHPTLGPSFPLGWEEEQKLESCGSSECS